MVRPAAVSIVDVGKRELPIRPCPDIYADPNLDPAPLDEFFLFR